MHAKRTAILLAALLAALPLGHLGCDSGDGDGDGDADTDVDSDVDSDADTDVDADGDCSGLDQACDPVECCDPSHLCAGTERDGYFCLGPCTPSLCTTGHAEPLEGICDDVTGGSGVGVCVHAGMTTSECDPGSPAPCTTAYGVEGLCVGDTSGLVRCLEECAATATGCDDLHICAPLEEPSSTGAEGVCLPAG